MQLLWQHLFLPQSWEFLQSTNLLSLFCIQGLRWCAKRLRIDEDGDVAHEFLDEVLPDATELEEKPLPKFAVRYSTRPAMVKNQVISHDGKVQHCVEHHGRLEWV